MLRTVMLVFAVLLSQASLTVAMTLPAHACCEWPRDKGKKCECWK